MGYASRERQRMQSRLAGLTVAVDVQHVYRPSHPTDEGSIFTDAAGQHITEAHLSAVYAIALCSWLKDRGATVITNDRATGRLVGEYWTRNHQAAAWGACAYLACHVNAGGGKYATVEYMSSQPGAALALAVLAMLPGAAPELVGSRARALSRGDRGAVCIESFPPDRGAAVILEPFFGDCPAHRPLWAAPRLAGLAGAIGEGVARWWENQWTRRAQAQPPA